MDDLSPTGSTGLQSVGPRENRAPFRKGSLYIRQMSRLADRMKAEDRDYFLRPPIIINSFPNTSTDLLFRIACAFPGVRDYGSFISSQPTIPFRERTDVAHDRLIRRVVPGEVLRAHLFFNDGNARRISARNGVHFFLYRDLRDVAAVEAHDLTYVKFWHRLHPFFSRLRNDEERLTAAIVGFPNSNFPYNYPNIAQRFIRYEGWLNRYDVMGIRYEDLYSNRLEKIVEKMARFYSDRCRTSVDKDRLITQAIAIREAEPACTLRGIPLGGWSHVFTERHYREFESVAGDLNRRLQYAGAPDSPPQSAVNQREVPYPRKSGVVLLRTPEHASRRG